MIIPAAISAGASLYSAIRGGKGGGGKKGGGESASDTSLFRPFQRTAGPLSKQINHFIKDPRFAAGLSQAMDYYSNPFGNADNRLGLDAFRQQAQDPFRLTDPFFKQQSEELAGRLNEQSRRGGLFSSGRDTLVSQGLSDFTNRYLNAGASRQLQAAQGLMGATSNLANQYFTPFQQFTNAAGTFGGAARIAPPPQYDNSKNQLLGTMGTLGGGLLSNPSLFNRGGSTAGMQATGPTQFGNYTYHPPSLGGEIPFMGGWGAQF